MPAYRFKAKARTWRERRHPESLEKRHAKGVADRRVECWPDSDGMAWVAARLPADQALAIWNRLNALARGTALLGLTDEPAMLDGHGPIPASMARGLVANGAESFHRVLVDPRGGAPLEIGRPATGSPRR